MVSLVTKPADNGNPIIQMIPKATNVIVNDYSFRLVNKSNPREAHEISIQCVEILDVVSIDVEAMLAIQSVRDEVLFRVENVQQSICIALLRSRIDHNLVVGSHAFQQIEQKRTHVRVDRETLSLVSNLRLTSALLSHGKGQICGGIALHGAVYQRFVKIQNERVFGSRRRLGREKNALLHRSGERVIGRKVFNNDNTRTQTELKPKTD